MATVITDAYEWINEHHNVIRKVLKRYEIDNGDPNPGWRTGLEGIRSMLRDAAASKLRVRSYGGRWSLSDVAVCNDIVHNSKPLKSFFRIGRSMISGSPLFNSPMPLENRLLFVQCGAQIMQLNSMLEAKGLVLPTTGASNGQTIAGAVSTGTHGSALNVGSMQDYVRALHIVTSGADHFLVQPSSPLLSDDFAAALGATPLNDDNVFYSALVSFGSFGIIHGLVIETVPLFMLDTSCKRVSFADAAALFPILAAYNPADDAAIRGYLQHYGIMSNGILHHVDLTINPYKNTDNMYLRAMFRLDAGQTRPSPPDPGGGRVADDIIGIVGDFANLFSGSVPFFVNLLFGSVAKEVRNAIYTPKDTFGDTRRLDNKQGGTSIEIGLPVQYAADAIELVRRVTADAQIPGVLGVRFVKPTRAVLGFTRFAPLTCTVEIPAVRTNAAEAGYLHILKALDSAGIPFTLHWGQVGDYSSTRLYRMYGASVKTWTDARKALLPDGFQRYMFDNNFTKGCGLAEEMPLSEGVPIA